MLHLLYIFAFTLLAFIAVANLVRNLILFSFDRERVYPPKSVSLGDRNTHKSFTPHPELLDESGNLIREPLLVMRSIDVDDARQKLDALYEASPGQKIEKEE
ncbi:DUF2973 domain-containing protein [Scytonema sp. NUACC26]|uniref:DUF2973 domain-containing protein n=1 Tax=Scytonema sp. NUACC26 TaxID=3140176 RepID=UPI0034DC381C